MSYRRVWQIIGRHALWKTLEEGDVLDERRADLERLLLRLEASASKAEEISLCERIAGCIRTDSRAAGVRMAALLARAKAMYFDGIDDALKSAVDDVGRLENPFLQHAYLDVWLLLEALNRAYVQGDVDAHPNLQVLTRSKNAVVADLAWNYRGLIALDSGRREEAETCLAAVRSLALPDAGPHQYASPSTLLADALAATASNARPPS